MLGQCSCPCFQGSRVPDCSCPGDPDVTPLLQVRWKRLVVDEGHTAGNVSTVINHFVRQLSIERKWIVTGTPTSNILGLSLGRSGEEFNMGDTDCSEPQSPSGSFTSDEPSSSTNTEEPCTRIWSRYDGHNLRKLGTMISDFLAVPQFFADHNAFSFHVSSPLCHRCGPRPWAIEILGRVMQMVMVRHRHVLYDI